MYALHSNDEQRFHNLDFKTEFKPINSFKKYHHQSFNHMS